MGIIEKISTSSIQLCTSDQNLNILNLSHLGDPLGSTILPQKGPVSSQASLLHHELGITKKT